MVCLQGPDCVLSVSLSLSSSSSSSSLCLDFFEKDQFFIILEFEFGGVDLENSNGTVSAHQSGVSSMRAPLWHTAFCSDTERSSIMSLLKTSLTLWGKKKKLKRAHSEPPPTWVMWPEIIFNKLQLNVSPP